MRPKFPVLTATTIAACCFWAAAGILVLIDPSGRWWQWAGLFAIVLLLVSAGIVVFRPNGPR